MTRPLLNRALASLLLLATGLAAGAAEPKPAYTPANHVGVLRLPPEVRRVVLLPVSGGALLTPEAAADLDQTFVTALQRQVRFEVVPVSRAWCRRYFAQEDFSSVTPLPHDLLLRLASEHAADAVLFVDVTAYRDFRPLTMGVRAKLATFDGPRILWTFDEVIGADNPGVAAGAQAHAKAARASGLPVDLGASGLQSPSRFAAYAADLVFGTLPAR